MTFLLVCKGEMAKQRRNYFSTWSTYISLLLWPILTVGTVIYSYKSFDISMLNVIGIHSESDLWIFLLTGFLCYNCFWVMVQSAFFMQRERQNGTLETIFLAPAPRLAIMYGRSLGALFQSTWILLLYTVAVLMIQRDKIVDVIVVLPVVYIIVIVSAVCWGGFINSIFVISRDIDFWFSLCDEPMKLLAGVSLPVKIMPMILRLISAVFPLTYSLEIIRQLLVGGGLDFSVLSRYIIANLVVVAITVFILSKAEKNNRVTGNLSLY